MQQSKLVLGIDLEGINQDLIYKGLNLETDRVSEIGAVLWDWNFHQPVAILSKIIDEKDHISISKELEDLTGLNDQILNLYGAKEQEIIKILEELNQLIKKADYLMAHNGDNYDLPMLHAMYKRYNVEWIEKTWLNSQTDIEYKNHIKQRSLAMLEYSHGFINPFPHRAITDVLSMLKITSQYPLERMVKIATSPKIKLIAKLDPPNWKRKDQVEEFNLEKNKIARSGFRWDPYEKHWYLKTSKIFIEEDSLFFDFKWYISND